MFKVKVVYDFEFYSKSLRPQKRAEPEIRERYIPPTALRRPFRTSSIYIHASVVVQWTHTGSRCANLLGTPTHQGHTKIITEHDERFMCEKVPEQNGSETSLISTPS